MEYQKTAESTGDLIGNKIANKIKFQKVRNKIVQRHLEIKMIKKHLKSDISRIKAKIIDNLRSV